VIIDACFAGGFFQNFFNSVDLWSDPWVVIFASCRAGEASDTFTVTRWDGVSFELSVFTYFFYRFIMDFGGQIFTNLQLAQEVFSRVATFMSFLQSPLGFLHLSFAGL
jgi:hypothetical protein